MTTTTKRKRKTRKTMVTPLDFIASLELWEDDDGRDNR
jgi:hypothetical protein